MEKRTQWKGSSKIKAKQNSLLFQNHHKQPICIFFKVAAIWGNIISILEIVQPFRLFEKKKGVKIFKFIYL